MNYFYNGQEMDSQELYKHRLGATALLEVEPCSLKQALYMKSGFPRLEMDPMTAYMYLLQEMGLEEIWSSVLYADDFEDGSNDLYYFGDGLSAQVPAVREGSVKRENLRIATEELRQMNLPVEEFSMDKSDIGERIIQEMADRSKDLEQRDGSEEHLDEPEKGQTLQILEEQLNRKEEKGLVEISVVCDRDEKDQWHIIDPFPEQIIIDSYAIQVEQNVDNGYRVYNPMQSTTLMEEELAEAMDVLNLCKNLGYQYVDLPKYMERMEEFLVLSGLRVNEEQKRYPSLRWRGRYADDIKEEEACYRTYHNLRDENRYYPSMVYGRGFSIECKAYTSTIVEGIDGSSMRNRVRLNLQRFPRTRIYGSIFYADPYKDFFCSPLKLRRGERPREEDLETDTRMELQCVRSRNEIKKILGRKFYSMSKLERTRWKDARARSSYPRLILSWVMMVPDWYELYVSVRYQVLQDRLSYQDPQQSGVT